MHVLVLVQCFHLIEEIPFYYTRPETKEGRAVPRYQAPSTSQRRQAFYLRLQLQPGSIKSAQNFTSDFYGKCVSLSE